MQYSMTTHVPRSSMCHFLIVPHVYHGSLPCHHCHIITTKSALPHHHYHVSIPHQHYHVITATPEWHIITATCLYHFDFFPVGPELWSAINFAYGGHLSSHSRYQKSLLELLEMVLVLRQCEDFKIVFILDPLGSFLSTKNLLDHKNFIIH